MYPFKDLDDFPYQRDPSYLKALGLLEAHLGFLGLLERRPDRQDAVGQIYIRQRSANNSPRRAPVAAATRSDRPSSSRFARDFFWPKWRILKSNPLDKRLLRKFRMYPRTAQ